MYQLNLVTSIGDIDSLIRMANRDKRTANLKKETLSLRNDNASENETERAADLLAAQSELALQIALIDSLPAGPRKELEITKKMAVEVRLRKLTQGSSDESPLSVAERSYDLDLMDKEMAGIDAFLAALQARRIELN